MLNEMFLLLPFEIAREFLAKKPGTFGHFDQLLAEQVRKLMPKMVWNCHQFKNSNFSKAMKNNKWNLEHYGPELTNPLPGGIGFTPFFGAYGEFIAVRTVLPIPQMSPNGIIAYFEVKFDAYKPNSR